MSCDQRPLRMRSLRLAWTGLLVAAGLVLSACGSSGGSAPAATTAAGAASVPAASTITSPSVGSSSTPSNAPSASSGGGGGSLLSGSFCSIAKQEQAQSEKEATAYSGGDPASLEKLETDGLAELQKFVAIAPGAIKSDVEVLAAADQKLFAALKAAKFQIAKVDPTVLSSLSTPAFTTATKHITAYLATTCGIKDEASTSN